MKRHNLTDRPAPLVKRTTPTQYNQALPSQPRDGDIVRVRRTLDAVYFDRSSRLNALPMKLMKDLMVPMTTVHTCNDYMPWVPYRKCAIVRHTLPLDPVVEKFRHDRQNWLSLVPLDVLRNVLQPYLAATDGTHMVALPGAIERRAQPSEVVHPTFHVFNFLYEEGRVRAQYINQDDRWKQVEISMSPSHMIVNELGAVIVLRNSTPNISFVASQLQVFVRHGLGNLVFEPRVASPIHYVLDNGLTFTSYSVANSSVITVTTRMSRLYGPPIYMDSREESLQPNCVRGLPRWTADHPMPAPLREVLNTKLIPLPKSLLQPHTTHHHECPNRGLAASELSRPDRPRCRIGCATEYRRASVHALCADRVGTMCLAIESECKMQLSWHEYCYMSKIAVISQEGRLLYQFHPDMVVEAMCIDARGYLIVRGHVSRYTNQAQYELPAGHKNNEIRVYDIR